MSYLQLVDELVKEGYLKTPEIIDAFKKIDRADFMLEKYKENAGVNTPFPIGFGQTISQPLTVAFMLELLKPQKGDKILDIGSGSGWQTALMAEIVGARGKVFAIEIIPELVQFGKNNAAKYNFVEKGMIEFIVGDGSKGLPGEAPFDKIIVAAEGKTMPHQFKEQLKIFGRLVMPVRGSIWLLTKKGVSDFDEKEFPGFAFVPLVTK